MNVSVYVSVCAGGSVGSMDVGQPKQFHFYFLC